MHDCLRVPEILDQILTIVLQDQPGVKGRNNVVSMGLSCREFLELALDVSWKTQSSMVPLIKTLPSYCWEESPSSSSSTNGFRSFHCHFTLLVKELTVEDEKTFMFYAKRIRKLEYLPFAYHAVPGDGGPYDLKIIRAIWATRTDKTQPLFPNLQHLVFAVIDHAAVSLDVFLETKQVSLALYWNDSLGLTRLGKAVDKTTPLFPIIEKHALNMQELDLGDFQGFQRHTRGCDTALSELVCKMTDLRALSTGSRPLNDHAIQHLSSLPHLRKLRVPNSSEEISPGIRKLTHISPFPELQEFVLRETKFPSFVSLMKDLRPIHIQHLVIQVSHIPRSGEILDVFVALAEESSSVGNIHRIEIKFIADLNIARRGHQQLDNPFALDRCPTRVDGNTLEPLLSFINLTVLDFDLPCKFRLGDPEIKAMADAWPRLRRLKLGSYLGWHDPSTITYDGFLYLLLKCPELTDLAFAFDAASHIPTAIPPGHVNRNISYLYIGNSRRGTNSPDSVGKFLAAVFPNCRGISGEWIMGSSTSNQASSNCSEWEPVVAAMKKHQEPKEVPGKEEIKGEASHKSKYKLFGS